MTFRKVEIYIEQRTIRRLSWLAKLNEVTTAELADKLLNEVMEQRWPQILEAEKVRAEADKKCSEILQNNET